MMRSTPSSNRLTPRPISSASAHLRASLRTTVSVWALAAAALTCAAEPARAVCTPTQTPTTGETVTCDSNQPNPVTTPIVAQPGSTNVTINMLSGAQLNVGGGDAVVLGGVGKSPTIPARSSRACKESTSPDLRPSATADRSAATADPAWFSTAPATSR